MFYRDGNSGFTILKSRIGTLSLGNLINSPGALYSESSLGFSSYEYLFLKGEYQCYLNFFPPLHALIQLNPSASRVSGKHVTEPHLQNLSKGKRLRLLILV